MTFRFSFLAAVFISLVLFAGCKKEAVVNASGRTSVTLALDWYPQPEHGGFYNALVRGYYKEAGLDVTIVPGGPNSMTGQMVATGKGEFGLATSDDLSIYAEQGLPLVAIAPFMQHDPKGVMVHPESGIENFAQMDGKAISANPAGAWFRYVNKKFNWKTARTVPLTFSVANFIADPNYIQEVFVTSEPYFLQKTGVKYRILLTRDVGFKPYRVFFTRKDLIQKNPKLVQAFVTASLRGWRDYMVDPKVANTEIQKLNPEMEPEKMNFTWKAMGDGKFISGDQPGDFGKFDPARIKQQYDNLKSIGVLTKDLGPEASYTTQFLEK